MSYLEALKILDAVVANGIGTPILVVDFRHLLLTYDTTGTTTATTKIQGSLQHTMPDFNAAQSPSNQWDFLKITDLEDGSSLDGDVGIALSGADANRQFEVDTNAIRWLCAKVTGWTQGALTLQAMPRNDA